MHQNGKTSNSYRTMVGSKKKKQQQHWIGFEEEEEIKNNYRGHQPTKQQSAFWYKRDRCLQTINCGTTRLATNWRKLDRVCLVVKDCKQLAYVRQCLLGCKRLQADADLLTIFYNQGNKRNNKKQEQQQE